MAINSLEIKNKTDYDVALNLDDDTIILYIFLFIV